MINKKNKKFADNYVDSAVVQKEIIKRFKHFYERIFIYKIHS